MKSGRDTMVTANCYENLFYEFARPLIVFKPATLEIIDLNSAAVRLLDRKKEKLINRPLTDIHPAAGREQSRLLYELLAERVAAQKEYSRQASLTIDLPTAENLDIPARIFSFK
ncbi:MAG: hypothetical protein ACLFN5_00675, partial [bacterium]